MKDDTSDEVVEIIDLTGEDSPVIQRQTEEIIDLTKDFFVKIHKHQEKNAANVTTSRRSSSSMQTASISKHKNIDIVDLVGGSTSSLSFKSENEAVKSMISKSPGKPKQDYLFASLTTPKEPSVREHRHESSSVVIAPSTHPVSSSSNPSKENVFPIFRDKGEVQTLERDSRNDNIQSRTSGGKGFDSLERMNDALEYQRNRVHNTRKNSPPPEIRETVPKYNQTVIDREKNVPSKLPKQQTQPVLERPQPPSVQIKEEMPRSISQCREHIGRFLTKINAKNLRKKPIETAVQPGDKSLQPMESMNEGLNLSSANQIETMLLNKERLVVMPEFLYQGVLEMCRSDTDRALRLIQDALRGNNLTRYLFLINAQAIMNNMGDDVRSEPSSGQILGHWRDLINCLKKCSFVANSNSNANSKAINQCTQILRIWNDFLVVDLLQDESEWDIGALLSIRMKAFLSVDGTEATFEGSISFLEILSTFLANTFRRRRMFFANHFETGAAISDAGSPVDMSGVYKTVLHIMDPSTQEDNEEVQKQPVKKGKPGRKPRTETSACNVADFRGRSNSSSKVPETCFTYQHLFGDTKVFEWDPSIAMRMLKIVTHDLIPDKEFALFLLKAIVDVLAGFDDSSTQSADDIDSKWTDLCAFIYADRVSDLCKLVLSGGLVSGSPTTQKNPVIGDEKSPLAELKCIVAGKGV